MRSMRSSNEPTGVGAGYTLTRATIEARSAPERPALRLSASVRRPALARCVVGGPGDLQQFARPLHSCAAATSPSRRTGAVHRVPLTKKAVARLRSPRLLQPTVLRRNSANSWRSSLVTPRPLESWRGDGARRVTRHFSVTAGATEASRPLHGNQTVNYSGKQSVKPQEGAL